MLKRRSLLKAIALGAAAAGAPPAFSRGKRLGKLKIGYTCITWGTFPKPETFPTLEPALQDIAAEGFWSFETFPEVLDDWGKRGLLAPLLAKDGVPLRSGYITGNLIDPAKRKDEIARITALSKVVQQSKGTFVVLAPNSVRRESYDFHLHRTNIVSALNDYAAVIADLGLTTGLHQHTGTCIESRDEVYAVMEAVNTSNLKFAPDVGQLQKGGADAARVVKDFLPLVKHMHLKDYKGWEPYLGYCPLGMGSVDIPAILEMAEKAHLQGDVMVELDPSPNAPMTPIEAAKTSKAYLEKLGYTFRPVTRAIAG